MVATKFQGPGEKHPPMVNASPWQGRAELSFALDAAGTTGFQGGSTAPLRLQRSFCRGDGRCELPLLHTAGGLVGGDELWVEAKLAAGSRALITTVAAQKVYGSRGRSRQQPQGRWARQQLHFQLEAEADLEWLPQETVVFSGGLLEQHCRVQLAADAHWLGAEVVRLGRTASGESLGCGQWRSHLEIQRQGQWELVDRLELGGEALTAPHGMDGQPVFGSLAWACPGAVPAELLELCRADSQGLPGSLACGSLERGLIARYRGPSSQAARFWFTRIWARIRQHRGLAAAELPRVWPFQEAPLWGQAQDRCTVQPERSA